MSQPLTLLLQNILPKSTSWEQNLVRNWARIVGNLSRHVRVEKIIGSTVVLGVYDQRWLHELFLVSPLLIDKMNEFLKENTVTNIRFTHVTKYDKKKPKIIKLGFFLAINCCNRFRQ